MRPFEKEGEPTVLGRRLLGAAAAIFASLAGPSTQAAPPGGIPFGVYDPTGAFSDDPAVEIEHLFLPWEDVYLPSLVDADIYARARGRALLVTIEPWTWSRSQRNTPENLRYGIANGLYDGNMRSICEILNTLESPITVRWAHEMDDDNGQFIWAGWDPDDYISAYRRMIDVCRAAAPSVNFMWSPLGDEGMELYYPGDNYVDLVGITVFGLQAWDRDKYGADRGFVDILRPRYERADAFGKPIVVAELGYVGSDSYVAAWESTVRLEREEFPNLVGVIYFNYPEVYPWPDGFGLPDWQIANRVLN
ncbi:glycoside hydrolase family 26 protein [Ostreiculturibacter nitratireducens]|uniref:glycoside hydrolase family 26 protein n=1 Tax=Ostreiculturibacter nitratireducens TaxID=3075226 RepID=UPI0031B56505